MVEVPTTQTSFGAITRMSRSSVCVDPAGAAGESVSPAPHGSVGCVGGFAGNPQSSRSRSALRLVTPGWL